MSAFVAFTSRDKEMVSGRIFIQHAPDDSRDKLG